jgi:hypothetical protein
MDQEQLLTAEEVRRALAQFVELAAAYEGAGVEVPAGDRAADAKVLTLVTRALLSHRDGQRLQQRDVAHAIGHTLVARAYEANQNSTQLDLQEQLVREFGELGVVLSDDDLNTLVIFYERDGQIGRHEASARSNGFADEHEEDASSEDDEVTVKGEGGAVQAAKKTLGTILGWSKRGFHDVIRRASRLPFCRVAFGRWVGRSARNKYLRELLAAWEQDAAAGETPWAGSLESLRTIAESVGDKLDSAVERLTLSTFTTTEGLLWILSTDSEVDAISKAQDTFRKRCILYASLITCLIAIDPDTAEQRFAELPRPGLSDDLVAATRPLISALKARNKDATEQAVAVFQSAVILHLIESARAVHAKHFETLNQGA